MWENPFLPAVEASESSEDKCQPIYPLLGSGFLLILDMRASDKERNNITNIYLTTNNLYGLLANDFKI